MQQPIKTKKVMKTRNVSAWFFAVGSTAGEVGTKETTTPQKTSRKKFTGQTEIEWTVLGFLLDILFSGIGHKQHLFRGSRRYFFSDGRENLFAQPSHPPHPFKEKIKSPRGKMKSRKQTTSSNFFVFPLA